MKLKRVLDICTNFTCLCVTFSPLPPPTPEALQFLSPSPASSLLYVNLFYFIRPFAWCVKVAGLRKWKARETSKKILATWSPYSCPASQKIPATPLPAPSHSIWPFILPILSIVNGRKEVWGFSGTGGTSVDTNWKFLNSKLEHLFSVINTGTQELDLTKLFSLSLSFHFLPLKVSTGNSPALVWVFGSVILETFSIHPTIKTLQLHIVFLKRKLDAIRSFEDGLACRLHNIKKNHIGKWRDLFEELWRKAANELYIGFPSCSQRVNTICGKGKKIPCGIKMLCQRFVSSPL